jgi:hypothetical protein
LAKHISKYLPLERGGKGLDRNSGSEMTFLVNCERPLASNGTILGSKSPEYMPQNLPNDKSILQVINKKSPTFVSVKRW